MIVPSQLWGCCVHLLLDSSGSELVCALADQEGVILEERRRTGTADSRDIATVAGSVLGELLVRDLKSVVVGTGPGSFIGTRVAISYANGLGANGAVPLHGVNSLAAIAAVHGAGRNVVLRDARRGEVYFFHQGDVEQVVRLVAITELARELIAQGIVNVVIEEPAQQRRSFMETQNLIRRACSEAGAECSSCSGVPAEGLHRLRNIANPVDYVEPVYLRGFLS